MLRWQGLTKSCKNTYKKYEVSARLWYSVSDIYIVYIILDLEMDI